MPKTLARSLERVVPRGTVGLVFSSQRATKGTDSLKRNQKIWANHNWPYPYNIDTSAGALIGSDKYRQQPCSGRLREGIRLD